MLETVTSLSLLTLMEIVGPVLLGVALAYGILRSRRRSRSDRLRTDAATRNLYQQSATREDNR
jgi:hypothetical protein